MLERVADILRGLAKIFGKAHCILQRHAGALGEVFAPLVAHQDMVREALEERKPVARQRLTLQVLGGEITADLVVYPLLAERGEGWSSALTTRPSAPSWRKC